MVGIPAAGQSVDRQPDLVGPLREHARRCARQWIRDAAASAAAQARAHDDARRATSTSGVTFGALLKKLPLARDPSRLPLVIGALQRRPGGHAASSSFDGLR